jgi:hypothetical protein
MDPTKLKKDIGRHPRIFVEVDNQVFDCVRLLRLAPYTKVRRRQTISSGKSAINV